MNAPLSRVWAAPAVLAILVFSLPNHPPSKSASPPRAVPHAAARSDGHEAVGAHTDDPAQKLSGALIQTGFSDAAGEVAAPGVVGLPRAAGGGFSEAAVPHPVGPPAIGAKFTPPAPRGSSVPVLMPNPALAPAGANGQVTQAEVDTLESDLVTALTALEASLVEEAFSETLPLVGDRFSAVWDNNVAGFRFLERLRNAARDGLATLTGGGPFTPAQVQNAINARLTNTTGGFNTGSRVVVTTANDQVQLAFETVDTFSGVAVPIGSDFGLPNLDLDLLAAANVTTGGSLVCNFTMGLDASGFYLDALAPQTITFNTSTAVSTTLNARVRFAKLPFRLSDDTSPRSSMTANFSLQLRDPDGSGKIRLSEMNGLPDLMDGTVTGNAALSFTITSDLPDAATLPKVRTDLAVTWAYTAVPLNEDDNNTTFGTPPVPAFNNASLNVVSFFKTFAFRVLRGIADVTRPLDELIDVLTMEIPLLSDLGSDPVTVLDIAGAAPEQVAAIGALDALSDLAEWTADATTADTVWMNMGSFSLTGADLRTQPASALSRQRITGPAAPPADMATFLGLAGDIEGLQFPLLTNPDLLADLLMGRPADLFSFRSQEIEIEEEFHAFYPVIGPIGVTLGGHVGARTQFGFGYDTQGMFDYAAAGDGADPALLFNGFYAMALDENGDPFTGISLFAGITAGVEANVVVASVGVEGDITAEIGMYLDDFIGDDLGRVRGNVIHSMPFEDLFYAAGSLSAGLRVYVEVGISPFSVGFDWESPRVILINFDSRDTDVPVLAEMENTTLVLNVGERSGRRIHGNLDDRAEEFTITAGVGLVVSAFGEDNTFDAPARILAEPNLRGDVIEIAPDVIVPAELHGGDGRDELTGGAGNDSLHGDDGPDKLRGQGGNNNLYGGADNDELTGGPGADLYNGGPGDDTASWADDIAAMTMDLRTGAFGGVAALDMLVSIERYRGTPFSDTMDGSDGFDSLLSGEGGNDTIRGHAGNDLLEGDAGDDILDGGEGNDMITGGSGADAMDGGPGTDTLSYLRAGLINPPPGVRLDPVTVNLATGQGTRGDALGDTFSSFEILLGSGVPAGYDTPFGTGDDLTGSDNPEIIQGMGGTDLIHGGGGHDTLYGDSELADSPLMPGFDADRLYGDAGNDRIFGQWDNDVIEGGDGNDMLDGGTGNDDLDGGPGTDNLLGGDDDDHLRSTDPASTDTLDGGPGYNRLSADYSDKTTPLNFTVGQMNAHTFPDGDQYSFMQTPGILTTGSGNDVIRLSAAQEPYYYPKTINTGAGNDLVIADWRGLYPVGQSGLRSGDSLHGGDGNDTISFEQSISAVSVNLTTPGLGGAAAGMTMSGFENIIGSHYVDNLTGDAGDNIFHPLDSPTPVANGQPFTESIAGGNGVDTLVIDCSTHPDANALGVYMGPNSPSTTISFGVIVGQYFPFVRYTHSNIEIYHITGGASGDRFYGEGIYGAYPDIFIGLGGNDYMEGRGGNDLLDGGEGDDQLHAGAGNDRLIGGPGNDALNYVRTDNFSSVLGQDEADAGPGDDSIYNVGNGNFLSSSLATAGTVFKCDGGDGYDTLSADFGNQTQPIVWDESKPINITFPDGSCIRSIERLAHFYSGNGDDLFLLQGREDSMINLLGGNDVINPGVGLDSIKGGPGDDLVIVDYSIGDDADTSGVAYENAVTPLRFERRRLSDNVLLDRLVMDTCERIHFTGSSKNDELIGLSGNDIILGGAGDDYIDGESGNDYLDGGAGADQMLGGPGNDFYLLDNTGDTVRELNPSGFDEGGVDTVRSSVSFTLPTAVEILNLTGSALNGTGNASANTITGNAQNNVLSGLNGNDTLNGGGGPDETDRLNGGANADTFVLGDGSVRYYDDGDPLSPGLGGYAVIEDFTPAQTDRLRLTGSAAQYFLGVSPVAEVSGTALYHDSNGSGVLEPATDELIAIINSPVALTPANTLTPGTYPQPVTPESIGLTESPVVTTSNPDGMGPRLSLQFTISDPMPAGALLEIQTSTDLGINDAWQTIAGKNGPAAWTGLVPVTVSAPVNGRVTVSLTDLQSPAGTPRVFLKFRLAAP